MRPSSTHTFIDIGVPFQGMDTGTHSTALALQMSPKCHNVVIEDGYVKKRKGGDELDVSGILGDIVGFVNFESEGGTKQHIIVTNEHQYLVESDETISEAYHYNFPSGAGEASNWTGDNDCEIDYDSETGITSCFNANALIAEDNMCHKTEEASRDITKSNALAVDVRSTKAFGAAELRMVITSGEDTVTLDLPAIEADTWTRVYLPGDMAEMDEVTEIKFVTMIGIDAEDCTLDFGDVYAVCLWESGDENDLVIYDSGADDNGKYVFMTNGVDPILYWDGSKMNLFQATGDMEGVQSCSSVVVYLGSLFLINIKIDGSWYPKDVAMSVPGDFFDFDSTGSDYRTIDETKDKLLTGHVLGPTLFLYASDAVISCSFVGGDVIYSLSLVYTMKSYILARTGVGKIVGFHVFVTKDNIYAFDGFTNPVIIGDRVRSYLVAQDADEISRVFCWRDDYNKRALFVVGENVVLVLSYKRILQGDYSWTYFTFENEARVFGFYEASTAITYNNLLTKALTYDELALTYDELTGESSLPRLVKCGTEDVLLFHQISYFDGDYDISGEWQSKDFSLPQVYRSNYGRWMETELELCGIDVIVSYSIDMGGTWTEISSFDLDSAWKRYKLYFDCVSETIRFKIRSTTYFELAWIRAWFAFAGV